MGEGFQTFSGPHAPAARARRAAMPSFKREMEDDIKPELEVSAARRTNERMNEWGATSLTRAASHPQIHMVFAGRRRNPTHLVSSACCARSDLRCLKLRVGWYLPRPLRSLLTSTND